MRTRVLVSLLAAACVVAAACSDDDGPDTTPPDTDPAPVEGTAPPGPAPTTSGAPAEGFATRPGVEQIAILNAPSGAEVTVHGTDGSVRARGETDELGSLLFRGIEPGDYTVAGAGAATGTITVPGADDVPNDRFYRDQTLDEGFGYVRVRDNTTLSVNVVLPEGDGPFPTVVEYSGYSPSDPDEFGFGTVLPQLGYAYVGVNMRGSGCSGGSGRYFETIQATDGYDVIEIVAAQDWVANEQVGMVGASYAGIAQLFVAQMQPPSLAAITPLGVLDDTFTSTLYPGGILNTGFAVDWMQERLAETAPEGQTWVVERIDDGDEECEANQLLRLQTPDLVTEIRDTPFYVPDIADPISPRTFVDRIEVPVFIAGAWQDEQTGGRFATMLDRFDRAPHLYASLVNGLHADPMSAGVIPRLVEFLDLYVAHQVPDLDVIRGVAPALASTIFGTDDVAGPDDVTFDDRFEGMTYEAALAAYESEPPIHVLFENGAADSRAPGTPNPRFVRSFDAWPIPSVEPTSMYLGAGALRNDPPPKAGTQTYRADPGARPATFFMGDDPSDAWLPRVQWDWQPVPEGTAASFVSAPLGETMTMIGSASADLWVTVDAPDTDLEVTLSEIRPDGHEVYVQSGWLRASHGSSLDEVSSTALQPVHTHIGDDVQPLEPGVAVPVRVEILPFAHVFRADSRIRITVGAPGNNRAVWVFETLSDGETVNVLYGGESASKVVLPVVPDVEIGGEHQSYPPCDALRGQPCRPAPTRYNSD